MKIIYPGSFNPWTNGHQDIHNRACKLFNAPVDVVIAVNPAKKIDIDFILWTLQPLSDRGIKVMATTDLVATQADVIVRGVRSGDWEYEQNLAQWNKELGAETVFLCPAPEFSHINSSAVRELRKYGKPVGKYCPKDILERWLTIDNFV